MKEEVYVSIRGLHSVVQNGTGEKSDDIEVIYPGTCKKLGDTWYVHYEEPVEGAKETIHSLLKIRPGAVEMTKRGFASAHMVFEKGKRALTSYETPFGQMQLGTAASRVAVTEREDLIDVQVEYALEMDGRYLSDCLVSVKVQPKETITI